MAHLGRVACVKLDNILDAMALLTGNVEVTLPLCTGKNDVPILYPSKFFM